MCSFTVIDITCTYLEGGRKRSVMVLIHVCALWKRCTFHSRVKPNIEVLGHREPLERIWRNLAQVLQSCTGKMNMFMINREQRRSNHPASAGLRSRDCEGLGTGFTSSSFCSVSPHTLWMETVILKDSTPIRIGIWIDL